jgi:hypothetical protein
MTSVTGTTGISTQKPAKAKIFSFRERVTAASLELIGGMKTNLKKLF